VQVATNSVLKASFDVLTVNYDEVLLCFARKLNLHHYTKVRAHAGSLAGIPREDDNGGGDGAGGEGGEKRKRRGAVKTGTGGGGKGKAEGGVMAVGISEHTDFEAGASSCPLL
jgi:hypothetical protein